MTYLINTNQSICQAAADQIAVNCQLPTETTACWAIPTHAHDESCWFIPCPPNSGWTTDQGVTFTREQMLDGVVEMTEDEGQSSWFPSLTLGD